jgi:O-antigen/teichoic acid export membrane protein
MTKQCSDTSSNPRSCCDGHDAVVGSSSQALNDSAKAPVFYSILSRGFNRAISMCVWLAAFFLPPSLAKRMQMLANNTMVKNTMALFLVNGLVGGCAILTQIKIANTLGPVIFGVYSFALAIGAYGDVFVRYGREKSMIRDLVQRPGQFDQIVGGTFLLSTANAFIFCVALGYYLGYSSGLYPSGMFLVVLGAILAAFDLQPVYDSWRRMGWHAIYRALQQSVFLGLVWIGIVWFPSIFALGYLGTMAIVSGVLVLWLQYREVRRRTGLVIFRRANIPVVLIQYRENLVLAVSMFLLLALGPAVRIFLEKYEGSHSVGIFSAAFQIVVIAKFALTQIARVGNPAMAKIVLPDVGAILRRRAVMKYLAVMVFTSIPFACPLIVVPEIIVRSAFSAEYSESASLLPYMGVYILLTSVVSVFAQYIMSARYDKCYFASVLVSGILAIVLCVWLIPACGLMGAVWALLIPKCVMLLLYGLVVLYSLFFASSTLPECH